MSWNIGGIIVRSAYFSFSGSSLDKKQTVQKHSHADPRKFLLNLTATREDGSAWSHTVMQYVTVLFVCTFDLKHKMCGMC